MFSRHYGDPQSDVRETSLHRGCADAAADTSGQAATSGGQWTVEAVAQRDVGFQAYRERQRGREEAAAAPGGGGRTSHVLARWRHCRMRLAELGSPPWQAKRQACAAVRGLQPKLEEGFQAAAAASGPSHVEEVLKVLRLEGHATAWNDGSALPGGPSITACGVGAAQCGCDHAGQWPAPAVPAHRK